MLPPLLSYVTFNRKDQVEKSLTSLLRSSDDFEMHIIDCHSADGTWEYLQSVKDKRIITRARIEMNCGPVYALNVNLTKRQKGQFVFSIDSNIIMQTPDWISRMMDVFELHDRIGLLGPLTDSTPARSVRSLINSDVEFLRIRNVVPNIDENFVPFSCMALSPALLDEIGYLSEENYYGDKELSYRVVNFTRFKAGFVPNIHLIEQEPPVDTHPELVKKLNQFETLRNLNRWKMEETLTDLHNGTRPIYCASLSDIHSMKNHVFNQAWATQNIGYFVAYAN